MKAAANQLILFLFLISFLALAGVADAADYTLGKFHNYTHEAGDVPKDVYQYSVYVPRVYSGAIPMQYYFMRYLTGISDTSRVERGYVAHKRGNNAITT